MIHKNRGNRRWTDKRKRKHKYNLAKRICNKIKDVIGKYDKGHIYDLNSKYKNAESSYDDYYKDGISHSYKKKVESCNDKLKDYKESWAMVTTDIESYYDWIAENNTEVKDAVD